MSDMIDRLEEVANDAGDLAHGRLATAVVQARMARDVRQGVRRRRLRTAGLTAAVLVVGAVAAVVLPRLYTAPPIQPAGEARVPIETSEGLITYSDGSMKVLNQHGQAIDVPAPAPDATSFGLPSRPEACAVNPADFRQGWTTQFVNAFQLVTFGRPLMLNSQGYHVLAQGQRVEIGSEWQTTAFAFSVDVDPAVAPYVVMTATTYVLGPDGRVAYVGSQMESQPAIEYTGDKTAGTYTATLTTRSLAPYDPCPGAADLANPATASGMVHYLVVNVYLNDGRGHVAPLGTHTSWITVVKENT